MGLVTPYYMNLIDQSQYNSASEQVLDAYRSPHGIREPLIEAKPQRVGGT